MFCSISSAAHSGIVILREFRDITEILILSAFLENMNHISTLDCTVVNQPCAAFCYMYAKFY